MPLLQFEVSNDAMRRLDELKEKIGADSYTEVVRNALKLYDAAVNEGGPNARMVVDRPDGTTAMVRLFE